jgi:tetratricopeptide (TPR) repeat protein
MDPTIIAAIVGGVIAGVFGIIYIVINFFLQKKDKKEESSSGKIRVEVITQPPPTTQEKPTLPAEIPSPPTPYFAHPYPLQANFTGRVKEREELTNWFKNDSQPMFAYIAIGGMGKSALTWFWLQEDIIKKGLAPDGIIWWSFYDREARFESFLAKAIQYASQGKIDPKEIGSTRERMEILYSLLYNHRFLLVLDGVERVLRAYAGLGSPYQGDEVKEDERGDFRACIDPNVGIFLQRLAGIPKTKTLLTSRLYPKELDNIAGCLRKDLDKLSKENAVEFFHRQKIKGARHEIEAACEPFGYHPLSLRLLSGMILKDPKYAGDIQAFTKFNPLPKLAPKEHNILELAYNSLDKEKQGFISKLAAFRNPMDYDSMSIFNEFGSEERFKEVLIELVDRGILLRDERDNRYDLHPIVRSYCYDKLKGKDAVHSQLRDYFASVPEPEKVDSLDDLATVIELYHHTVRAGRYDEAWGLFYERINKPAYYQFGAYTLQIELLRALFPDGEERPPRLKEEVAQAWTLNALANSYSLSGQPQKAVPLFEKVNDIYENVMKNKQYLAIGLGNLAYQQIAIGDLEAAESNLRRSIDLCQEIKDEFREAIAHYCLALLLIYRGEFVEVERELATVLKLSTDSNIPHIVWSYRALRALLMEDADKALKSAKRARELADVEKVERDIIWAEWLIGAAYLAKADLQKAEVHLHEALARDRRINLVDLEPDILLELAKLRFAQGQKEEAKKLAKDALEIAERCQYRLKQADIHNFLTEYYIDVKDMAKAKEHAEIAAERASCGYQPALKKAHQLASLIRKNT